MEVKLLVFLECLNNNLINLKKHKLLLEIIHECVLISYKLVYKNIFVPLHFQFYAVIV